MAMYLKITDGTTTIDLLGNVAATDFHLLADAYAPAVATRRRSQLGGILWEDVQENIPLRVKSSTNLATLLGNIETLNALIDQAGRWSDTGEGDPVIMRFSLTSDTTYKEAVILGPPPGQPAIILPESLTMKPLLDANTVVFLTLSFIRRGQWLGSEADDASTSTSNPGVMTCSLAAADILSPTRLELTNFTGATYGGAFMLLTDDADKLDVFTMSAETATGYTTLSDSAKRPFQGTNALRYAPPDTEFNRSGEYDISSLLLSTTKKMAVFMSFRRNSSNMEAVARVRVRPVTGGYNTLSAITTQAVPLNETAPTWYFMGFVNLPITLGDATSVQLAVEIKTDNTVSSVDIDACALMDMSNEQSQALYLPASDAQGLNATLYIDHRALTKPTPIAYVGSSLELSVPVRGNTYLNTKGTEVAGMILGTNADTSGPGYQYWCLVNAAGIKLSNVLTTARRPGYLVPQ
jgi:hypothetical protein